MNEKNTYVDHQIAIDKMIKRLEMVLSKNNFEVVRDKIYKPVQDTSCMFPWNRTKYLIALEALTSAIEGKDEKKDHKKEIQQCAWALLGVDLSQTVLDAATVASIGAAGLGLAIVIIAAMMLAAPTVAAGSSALLLKMTFSMVLKHSAGLVLHNGLMPTTWAAGEVFLAKTLVNPNLFFRSRFVEVLAPSKTTGYTIIN